MSRDKLAMELAHVFHVRTKGSVAHPRAAAWEWERMSDRQRNAWYAVAQYAIDHREDTT